MCKRSPLINDRFLEMVHDYQIKSKSLDLTAFYVVDQGSFSV